MATASQKIIEIKFFDLMRGLFRAAPTRQEPVNRMPLQTETEKQKKKKKETGKIDATR